MKPLEEYPTPEEVLEYISSAEKFFAIVKMAGFPFTK